jgi:2,3-dihydro-2,3-dihydroxybenzoate dehydrogenase
VTERGCAWVVGSGGIGQAFADRLAASNDVVCFDRMAGRGGRPSYVVDAADRAAFAAAAGKASERHGLPDLFVVTAGRVSSLTVEAATQEEAADVFTDNLLPVINTLHIAYALGPCRRRTVVIVTSNAAFAPRPEQPLYAAAKSAVAALVRSVAVRWSRAGFRYWA